MWSNNNGPGNTDGIANGGMNYYNSPYYYRVGSGGDSQEHQQPQQQPQLLYNQYRHDHHQQQQSPLQQQQYQQQQQGSEYDQPQQYSSVQAPSDSQQQQQEVLELGGQTVPQSHPTSVPNDEYSPHETSNQVPATNSTEATAESYNGDQSPHKTTPPADQSLEHTNNNGSHEITLNEYRKTPPLQIEWKDVEFKVKIRQTSSAKKKKSIRERMKRVEKQVLFKQSGFVEPGTILAIMGPSGCGKTSLLNILAQRVPKYTGEVFINGSVVDAKTVRSVVGMVPQDDVMTAKMTVLETLRFHAMLRIPKQFSRKQKMERVQEVISELGLDDCKNTYVGAPGISKGISGGERKRLAIGIELLTEPSILFLDEPTTGLDSSAAMGLMETLKQVASGGRSIIMTIHQPGSNLFTLFDKLLLMSKGKVCYFGDAKAVTHYFGNLGYHIPQHYNPADFAIETISMSTKGNTPAQQERTLRDKEKVKKIVDTWEQAEKPTPPPISADMSHINLKSYSGYATNMFVETVVLLWRSEMSIMRTKELTIARLGQNVLLAVVIGLIFLRLGTDERGIQNRAGVLYFICINLFFESLNASLTVFNAETPIFLRERVSREYRVISYYISKNLSELPYAFIFPAIFGIICYYLIGLRPSFSRCLALIGILIISSITAQSIGQAISACVDSFEMAQALATVSLVILILFGGFFITYKSLPVYTLWLYWISPFHYSFEALFLNEFEGRTFSCPSGNDDCQFRTGQDVIDFYDLSTALSTIYLDVIFLLTITVIMKILTFLGLYFLKKPKSGA